MSWRNRRLAAAGACLGLAALAVWAEDKHEYKTVPTEAALLEELPVRTLGTLRVVSNYNPIESVESITQGDDEFYVATWKQDGRSHDASITEEGVLLETNEELAMTQVPAAVQRTAEELFGSDGKMEYGRKTVVVYTARGVFRGHGREIIVTPTGELADDGEREAAEHARLESQTWPAVRVQSQPATADSPD